MKLKKTFTIGWIILALGFFALELPALLNEEAGDTLSEHIWFVLKLEGAGPLLTIGAAALLSWLVVHFLSPSIVHHVKQWWKRNVKS